MLICIRWAISYSTVSNSVCLCYSYSTTWTWVAQYVNIFCALYSMCHLFQWWKENYVCFNKIKNCKSVPFLRMSMKFTVHTPTHNTYSAWQKGVLPYSQRAGRPPKGVLHFNLYVYTQSRVWLNLADAGGLCA